MSVMLVASICTQAIKVDKRGMLRRAFRSRTLAGILGGRDMECVEHFDFCWLDKYWLHEAWSFFFRATKIHFKNTLPKSGAFLNKRDVRSFFCYP